MASNIKNQPARAEVEAAFIRETSARILAAPIAEHPKNPAISVVLSVDAAELLAKALENNDYL